ncbi:LuxR family transcriptional regulator [Steroidobacter sp. S1-65]|uniref:LuxR family transcriptional regulator n=1 Tax=Steroidobacter gossypii TaxID=2805490 RepID=A0ABS1X600_9GAMM|nr:LuxR family transcriptional regulator [Steroidobacter gossypii]MBM0108659.1 LuxR family transcriptional regulator [Steroidobacter gossypii]
MHQFEVAQGFIEQCQAGRPAQALARAFQAGTEALGFRHFACCSHVDPLQPPRRSVMLHSYPKEWAQLFSEAEFFEVDPVLLRASRSMVPFAWSMADFDEELSPPQQEIFHEARRYGLTRGYTVPIHSANSPRDFRASCTVVPDSDRLPKAAYFAVQLMAFYMYEAASKAAAEKDPPPLQKPLSKRERQCLELAAQGKSDWVSSKILGLSERTVHNHVENAKRRLQVATRVQAVVHALAGQQISLGDVVRCEPSPLSFESARMARVAARGRSKTAN